MQVGTTKDQGLYNKPSAAVHPEALAAGTLPHNITYTAAIALNPTKRHSYEALIKHLYRFKKFHKKKHEPQLFPKQHGWQYFLIPIQFYFFTKCKT